MASCGSALPVPMRLMLSYSGIAPSKKASPVSVEIKSLPIAQVWFEF
ncbi:hypothetical protein [Flavobacterium branchiophilum]|nr:hypothetical protein [Flavobacterium branchiophilum]